MLELPNDPRDRFFKIKIKKLLEKIPTRNPKHPFVNDFNESQWAMVKGLENKRFWVHIAARRTGKSYAAAILAIAKLLEPNQQVTVVAPNFTLSSIIWDYVTDMILLLKIETDKFNQKDKVVRLINGSTFRLLSANNRDSLVGRAANLLIIDEAAIIEDDEYFQRDLRPALSTFHDSRALFISTPRGKHNYLYKYYNYGQENSETYDPDWGSAVYSWRSNPLLSEKDIESAKRKLTSTLFKQEYECEWTSFEGVIYHMNDEKHLTDLSEITPRNPKYEFIAGLDMGYRDATAFVVLATDGSKFYVVDEFSFTETVTSKIAEQLKEKIDYWGIETIYIDSAAAQAKADLAYDYDIYCDNAIKSVNDGIAALQSLVDADAILFDITNANYSFQAMSAYRWNLKSEIPKPLHDDSSHLADAMRYAIYSYTKTKVEIYAAGKY